MTVKIKLIQEGIQRDQVLYKPDELIIKISRDDGFAPSPPEMYVALKMALSSFDNEPVLLSTKEALAEDLARTDVISRKTIKGFFDKLDQGKSVEEAKAADPVIK